MHSDAVKLRQCLFNLLSNACKFTENGRITLRVRREASPAGDWLTFAIEDSGIGMTPEQVQRLFQRFTQADETTTRKFGGTGLGLALSRAFQQAAWWRHHGGKHGGARHLLHPSRVGNGARCRAR